MLRSEFLNGAKLPDNVIANELYDILERLYMDGDVSKPSIYEAGRKLYDIIKRNALITTTDMYRKTLYELNEGLLRIFDKVEDMNKCL